MQDTNLTLYKLRALCEVLEAQSFTLAAERLYTTQPALSVHMRSLERFFGTRLVRQDGRRTVPTEAGAAVYRYAKEVLRETETLRQFVSDVAGGQAGQVAVGASDPIGSYVLPHHLVRFQQQHPRIEITLNIGPSPQVAADTLGGLNDFGVLETGVGVPEGLATEPLFEEPVVIVVAPDHPLAGATVDAIGLAREAIVARPAGAQPRTYFEWRLAELGVEVRRPVLELSTAEAIKRAVETGAGLAALYRCEAAAELRLGALAEVQVPELTLSQTVSLVFRRNKRFSPMARRLMEQIREALP
jgi:DNA-binding transcriptional LysR family regulator